MKNILVTGGKGQLASCIKSVQKGFTSLNIVYVDINELDISNFGEVMDFFNKKNFTHCINCAAYTAVDDAESNQNLAEKVNIEGPENLAKACKHKGVVLIHISTDFVFDGAESSLYSEENDENPLSVYGITKLKGEKAIARILDEHYIFRTSWLYSEYGDNFVKTMLSLGEERDKINVVCDQIGTPTYAEDLVAILLKIVDEDLSLFGLYHYSNEGVASWYDFAKAIFDLSGVKISVYPIKTESYPMPATRPKFSVMDKSKIKSTFKIAIPYWRDSLKLCLSSLNN